MARRSSEERLPGSGDPRWGKWCDPLLTYISGAKKRDWYQLEAWAKENKMGGSKLRNCIAWLYLNKRIKSERDKDDKVCWKVF